MWSSKMTTLAPSAMMSHNQALQQTTAKYPINMAIDTIQNRMTDQCYFEK